MRFSAAIARRSERVTTNLVLAETYRLTLHRDGVDAAFKALDRNGASPSVTVHFATSEDHAAALRWLERLSPRQVTYTDAVSFAVMEATGCSHVLGFDGDFVAAGFPSWQPQ